MLARILSLTFGSSLLVFLALPRAQVAAFPGPSLLSPMGPCSQLAALALGGDDDDGEADDDSKKDDSKKGSGKGAAKAGKGADEDGEPDEAKKPPKKIMSVDEQYVRDNLEKYLSPTTINFMPDGRVKLVFEFGKQLEEHEGIFTPRVSKDVRSKFRWSLRNEWGWGWGYTGSTKNKDGEWEYMWEGLRIANDGSAHLNCWFTDDVEAEVSYVQAVSSSPKQTVAVVFTNTSGNSVGSNFGTQCVTLASNGAISKRAGNIESVPTDRGFKLKLGVRDGKFEANRDGKQKSTMDYNKKNYASGRIGFIWGGGVASFIHRMEVTGKIDAKKMAEQIRKGPKK